MAYRKDVPAIVREYTEDPLWTPEEVAKAFKVDPKTVTRWSKAGKFGNIGQGYIRTLGGHRRFRESWINRYLLGDGDEPMHVVIPSAAELEEMEAEKNRKEKNNRGGRS